MLLEFFKRVIEPTSIKENDEYNKAFWKNVYENSPKAPVQFEPPRVVVYHGVNRDYAVLRKRNKYWVGTFNPYLNNSRIKVKEPPYDVCDGPWDTLDEALVGLNRLKVTAIESV